MIRLRALLNFGISVDPTWDYTDVSIWTGAELASGILCASLPAIHQLLTRILPNRLLSLFTSRSHSRSTPLPGRGSVPSAQRQRKGLSVFPLPSVSEYRSKSFGTTTDISSSSWTKSQTYVSRDMEHGHAHHRIPDSSSWLPLRTLLGGKSRSFRTSFWSAVDRSGSPPLSPRLYQPRANTDYYGTSLRTETAKGTGKLSDHDKVELLRVPEASHRTHGHRGSCDDDIEALPRIGILPDAEYSRSGPLRVWRDRR
jgi:hypothetical protein